jgi:hypothetical protein
VVASKEKQDNSNAFLDVTPERFSRLEKELIRGKAEYVSSVAPFENELRPDRTSE